MATRIDITGKRFGRLVVLEFSHNDKHSKAVWKCLCDCGNTTLSGGSSLRKGSSQSCGCYRLDRLRETCVTHGMKGSKEYQSWLHMKGRCHNPNNSGYRDYGARGIYVCDEWLNDFQAFYDHVGPAPPGDNTREIHISRIDNAKGYSPGNVEWTTRLKNNGNTRKNVIVNHEGNDMPLNQYLEKTGLAYRSAIKQIRDGTLRLSRIGDGTSIGRRPGKLLEGLPIGERKFSVIDESTHKIGGTGAADAK